MARKRARGEAPWIFRILLLPMLYGYLRLLSFLDYPSLDFVFQLPNAPFLTYGRNYLLLAACLLGFLLTWFFLIQGQRGIHRVTMPLLFALLTAVTDETIQTFSLERYPSVMDVWIDTAGACVGIAALLVLHSLITLLFKRKGT